MNVHRHAKIFTALLTTGSFDVKRKGGGIMSNQQLSEVENGFLLHLLAKELEETKMEFHHTKNNDFKEYLKEREEMIKHMISVFSVKQII